MSQLLTFDCYGTLIDTSPFWNELEKIGLEYGMKQNSLVNVYGNYEDRLMYGEEPFIVYSNIIYKALQYCEMELKVDKLTREYERLIKIHKELLPFPEVKSTLETLKRRGYRTAIMSNSDWRIMNDNLQSLGHDFNLVFLAEDLQAYKPQMSFFRQVQNKIGNESHIHIATGFWWDVVPAKKMNWQRVWVNRHFKKGINDYQPFKEINTLDQLIDYL
ncbi:HAD family hydrolase [Sporolactobacillus pectinivorans]|uniref:HAD family hydrolase n=1 Tax=Sporolactobacillus pectinivorans TaxID=1591408 RepID=UPI000C259864|nr:HAD family hydrolase [Sporolactobacillus pectinivorans]